MVRDESPERAAKAGKKSVAMLAALPCSACSGSDGGRKKMMTTATWRFANPEGSITLRRRCRRVCSSTSDKRYLIISLTKVCGRSGNSSSKIVNPNVRIDRNEIRLIGYVLNCLLMLLIERCCCCSLAELPTEDCRAGRTDRRERATTGYAPCRAGYR